VLFAVILPFRPCGSAKALSPGRKHLGVHRQTSAVILPQSVVERGGSSMAQPPEWQFWTDIGVKAVSAIGTVSAVIVALFGAKLRSVLIPPRLTLSLKERRGLRVGFTIPIDGGSYARTYARWYFARVESGKRWNSADGVYIFIWLCTSLKSGHHAR
jgi:hypothetical protein